MTDDGRRTADHISNNYLCAWCWSPLVVRRLDGAWRAVCPIHPLHHGTHATLTVELQKQQSAFDWLEFAQFYRRTEYAAQFGLMPEATAQERLERGRRALGRDDGALL